MGILDNLKNIHTNPLAMAGLGLLSMPTESRYPLNPLAFAMQGAQFGVDNRMAEQRMAQDAAAQAQTEREYALRIAEYQRRVMAENEAAVLAQQNAQALEQAIASLPLEEQAIARAMGPDYLKIKAKSQFDMPNIPAGYKLDENGNRVLDQDYWTARERVSALGRSEQPYFTQVVGNDGKLYAFNNRTGEANVATGADGAPITAAQYNPALLGDINEHKAAGTTRGTVTEQTALDLPNTIAQAEQTIAQVVALKTHPGMKDVVGVPDPLTLGGRVPGTTGADFRSRLEQIQGSQFLQAYQTLKGGGQITEVEGQKAQNAIARMQTTQSEKAFVEAADEFIGIIRKGVDRAKQKAAMAPQMQLPSGQMVTPNFAPPTNDGWSIRKK